MKKKLFIGMLFSPFMLLSQNAIESSHQIIEERMDFLLDREEAVELDYTTLFEQLQFYYHHPIFLNTATIEELEDLQLLNNIQINNLLDHISKHGKLIAIEELQSIDGFDVQTIRRIKPFVRVQSKTKDYQVKPRRILKNGKSQLFIRYSRIIEEKKGYKTTEDKTQNTGSAYLGSPDKIYARYKFNYPNKVSFGLTAEKDAGEEFFGSTNPYGFDFYSAHLFVKNTGFLEQLAIGDFQAQFGQGLTFSSGLSFGMSQNVQSIKRNSRKLVPYTSAQEDLFLRGVGATCDIGFFELSLFYSNNKVDANVIESDSSAQSLGISSLPIHGFHRTLNEIEDKNKVHNRYLGAHLNYRKKFVEIGITAVNNIIDANFRPITKIYNQFSQTGNDNTNVGLNYDYSHGNFSVFGEFSHSFNGGFAYTNGLLVILDPKLSVALQNRNYEQDFSPIQSTAIGESTTNTNEKGTYIGINAKPHDHLLLSAYMDRFSFPWLKFRVDAPSHGSRHLLQLDYIPSKRLKMYLRYRSRNKGKNIGGESVGLNKVVQESVRNYRFNLNYQVTEQIQLKSRLEYLYYQHGMLNENGLLVYQDLKYQAKNSPISFTSRFAIFNTDSYNSRIYAYESDVLYAFSIPAYYNKGSRLYFMVKYHLARGLDIWIRYAQTYYTNVESIGSGNEEIMGNTKSEIKVQLRFRL